MKIGYYQIVETGKIVWCGKSYPIKGYDHDLDIYYMSVPNNNNHIASTGPTKVFMEVGTDQETIQKYFKGLISIYDIKIV